MSGIAGIVTLDGAPVDSAAIRRMSDALAARGPHAHGTWQSEHVALAHRALRFSGGPHLAEPWVADHGGAVVTLDGRIDNGRELIDEIERDARPLRSSGDAEIVLRAYERWGSECATMLVGDFAFALWDKERRRLFCARDGVGIRPFYFCRDGDTLLFASELPPILRVMKRSRTPNEAMVAEYLAARVTSTTETLYEGISRLPPGHALVVDRGAVRTHRYWEPPSRVSIRYDREGDYAAHFREVFSEAVRCRLRGDGPVTVALSGGLDSSAVASVAAQLSPEAPPVALSLVFPGLACDESSYIDAVVERWNLASHRAEPAVSPAMYWQQARQFLDFPGHPNGLTETPLVDMARRVGSKIMLSGMAGDDWLDGTRDVHRWADLLVEGRARTLARELDVPSALTLARFLFARGRAVARSSLGAFARRRTTALRPPFMPERFARRVALAERLHARVAPPRSSFCGAAAYLAGTTPWRLHTGEIEDRMASAAGITVRHPFEDRRVIEFLLSVPAEVRRVGQRKKLILRRALDGILPDAVARRSDDADFSYDFLVAFEAFGEGAARSLAIAEAGWVDQREVERTYADVLRALRDAVRSRAASLYSPLIWPLWMVLGLELWYRAAFGVRAK